MVPLIDESNGGNICCRNHVRRLAEDRGIELYAIAAAERDQEAATSAFLSEHTVEHHVIPLRDERDAHVRPDAHGLRPMASFLATAAFQYPWELRALNQEHLQEWIEWAVAGYGIDTVVIDYTPSAYFLRLPLRNVRTCLIKLDREADFYAEQIRFGRTHHGRLTARISHARLLRAERAIEASVDRVVAIGEPDLPRSKTRSAAVGHAVPRSEGTALVVPIVEDSVFRWERRAPPELAGGRVDRDTTRSACGCTARTSICGRRRRRGRRTRPLAAAECRLSRSRRPRWRSGSFRRSR